jgi:hypothetical protein
MPAQRATFSTRALLVAGPVASALFPVVSLYSANPRTPFFGVLPSLVALAALALGVNAVFRSYARSATRGALAAMLFFVVLFAYGPVALPVETGDAERDALRRMVFALIYLALVVAWSALLLFARRARGAWDAPARIASVVVCASLAVAVAQTVWGALAIRPVVGAPPATVEVAGRRPDIYHVILDGYSRADVLRELYYLDNSEFVAALEQRGFYVAAEARANYNQTYLSLASMLSLEYLPEVSTLPGAGFRSEIGDTMVRHNLVVEKLRARGYRFVNIASADDITGNNGNADVELAGSSGIDVGEFELQLVLKTPLRQFAGSSFALFRATARQRTLSQLRSLEDAAAAARPAPAYVFAHVLCPHPPFVFAADGSDSGIDAPPTLDEGAGTAGGPEGYRAGYREQVKFLNTRVLAAVDAILAQHGEGDRPVIIISSDHGGGLEYELRRPDASPEWARWGRTGILQAVLAPDEVKRKLYPGMTPVNTYRILFDGLFDEKLGLLPDRSYWAEWDGPYRAHEVGAAELAVRPAVEQPQP